MAAAQVMCQVMLTAALVGASNFCEMFEQCCHNGRSITPCSVQIPCKDVRLANDFYHLTSEDFPVQQYKARIHSTTVCIIHYILPHIISHQKHKKDQPMSSINVLSVNAYNKQLLPKFNSVGFELRDISKSIDKEPYYKMIRRLYTTAIVKFKDVILKGYKPKDAVLMQKEKAILYEISSDFAKSNNAVIISEVERIKFRKVTGVEGTHIHFDDLPGIQYPSRDGTRITAWIPLSNIDNYPLIVGDVRKYFKYDSVCAGQDNIYSCAEEDDFKDAVFYLQETMSPTDVVFWNINNSPHGSLNLGSGKRTKARFALIFEFVMRHNY